MNCSFKTRILYALIFIFLGTVSSANAVKCTSNKCHPDIGKNKFVHGPVIANACEVCFDAKKGFSQVGDLIQCDNCRVTYPKSKIALEKGGCNPGPIDKNVAVENGELVINVSDVEAVSYLF